MPMLVPTYGYDAAAETDDSYASIIAAQTDGNSYNYVIAWCATHDAVLSFDAGTTGSICVQAGAGPIQVSFPRRTSAIHAANLVAESDYTALYVVAGYDGD